jgi:DNA-binding XRE family transcriptional regulator
MTIMQKPDPPVSFEDYKKSEHKKALEDFSYVLRQFDIQKSMVELALAELGRDTKELPEASVLSTNLDRFRLECGYTFEDLADAMGVDKKTVIRNIRNGVIPRPDTLQCYAQTFTQKLGKEITVSQLQGS